MVGLLHWWTWVWASSGRWWREAWCAAVHGVTKNWTQLSDWTKTVEKQFSVMSGENRVRDNPLFFPSCKWEGLVRVKGWTDNQLEAALCFFGYVFSFFKPLSSLRRPDTWKNDIIVWLGRVESWLELGREPDRRTKGWFWKPAVLAWASGKTAVEALWILLQNFKGSSGWGKLFEIMISDRAICIIYNFIYLFIYFYYIYIFF